MHQTEKQKKHQRNLHPTVGVGLWVSVDNESFNNTGIKRRGILDACLHSTRKQWRTKLRKIAEIAEFPSGLTWFTCLCQAGSADIIHVYHDDEPEYYDDYDLGGGPDNNDEEYETAPEYDEALEAAPEYDENFEAAPDYYEDLEAAPYDGSGPYDVGGPGPRDYQKKVIVTGPYDGPGPEYLPGPQGPGGPEPMYPKPDEYSGPGPQAPEPEEYAPEGPETEGPGPGYEAPENEEPEPADDGGPGPSYGGDLRVGYDKTVDIGPDEVEVEEVEGEAEPMEPTEPMEPESEAPEGTKPDMSDAVVVCGCQRMSDDVRCECLVDVRDKQVASSQIPLASNGSKCHRCAVIFEAWRKLARFTSA